MKRVLFDFTISKLKVAKFRRRWYKTSEPGCIHCEIDKTGSSWNKYSKKRACRNDRFIEY